MRVRIPPRAIVKGGMMEGVAEKVKGIIEESRGGFSGTKLVKDILDDSKLVEDLGMDSLDIVELQMALEEQFNIEIPDEEIEGCDTVRKVIKYVENKTQAKSKTAGEDK